MIWRTLVALAGAAVVAAATHANVLHAGGYQSGAAPLVITVAVLLALGMGFAVTAWRDGQRIGALALVVCLFAGEGYWLATNAERELAARDAIVRPVVEAAEKRAAAEKRLAEAEAAKKRAEEAAITEAAKRDCKSNCRQLLQDVMSAAESELNAARASLALLPVVRSVTPLSDRIGVPAWAWDLVLAGLRSLAVFGGSIAVALAVHPRPRTKTNRAEPERVKPAPVRHEPETTALVVMQPINEREHVAQFLRASLKPDPAGTASLRDLHAHYLDWCRSSAVEPLPAATLGHHLRTIVDAIGLECEPRDRDVVVRGAALAD